MNVNKKIAILLVNLYGVRENKAFSQSKNRIFGKQGRNKYCWNELEGWKEREQTPVSSKINPLPDDKIVDWSKLKQFADNILKCIKNGK